MDSSIQKPPMWRSLQKHFPETQERLQKRHYFLFSLKPPRSFMHWPSKWEKRLFSSDSHGRTPEDSVRKGMRPFLSKVYNSIQKYHLQIPQVPIHLSFQKIQEIAQSYLLHLLSFPLFFKWLTEPWQVFFFQNVRKFFFIQKHLLTTQKSIKPTILLSYLYSNRSNTHYTLIVVTNVSLPWKACFRK